MATLDEMRRRFAAGRAARKVADTPAAEDRAKATPPADRVRAAADAARAAPAPRVDPGVDLGKLRGRSKRPDVAVHGSGSAPPGVGSTGKYTILDGGADARLEFGRHGGSKVSDMARDGDAKGYLRWMQGKDFPDDIQAIIRRHLG